MAYTVTPPSPNQVTGEMEGDFVIEQHGDVGTNTFVDRDDQRSAEMAQYGLNPDFQRQKLLNHPAFFTDDGEIQSHIWRSDYQLNEDEVGAIQEVIAADPQENEHLGRLLEYKLTGNSNTLNPQEMDFLGLQEQTDRPYDPDLDERSDWNMSADQIDQIVIQGTDEPTPEKAQKAIRANLGNSNAAILVQYLAHQYYQGQISGEEAYTAAYKSGIDQNELRTKFIELGKWMK